MSATPAPAPAPPHTPGPRPFRSLSSGNVGAVLDFKEGPMPSLVHMHPEETVGEAMLGNMENRL